MVIFWGLPPAGSDGALLFNELKKADAAAAK